MYVIMGATGNIGSRITDELLSQGKKVRCIGRSEEKLKSLMDKGAEAAVGDVINAEFLNKATEGAEALFFMIPPNLQVEKYNQYQNMISDNGIEAVKKNNIKYVVTLSSQGAHLKEGNGVVGGLTEMEDKFNKLEGVNVLHLRPTFFMENFFDTIGLIKTQGINASSLKSENKIAMIATQDIAKAGTKQLMDLKFEGKSKLDLLGERDLSIKEATVILGKAINKPELPYVEVSETDMMGALTAMGLPKDSAGSIVELYDRVNDGTLLNDVTRNADNTTETSFEQFADYFARIYNQL